MPNRIRRWHKSNNVVTWAIASCPAHLPVDVVAAEYNRACQEWNRRCAIRLTGAVDIGEANIVIKFGRCPGQSLAVSGCPAEGCEQIEQTFDAKVRWLMPGRIGAVSFYRTALHEIGHAIGLVHLQDGNVMQETLAEFDELQAGDIAAALALYPTG